MKKLFISVPMRNRTEYAIKASMEQMHKIAEAVFGEELEVIPTYFEDDPPENTNMALWYLGESIKKLSEADRFIGIYDEDKGYRGCIIENLAAKNYGIPSYLVNVSYVAPDIIEQKRRDARIAHGKALAKRVLGKGKRGVVQVKADELHKVEAHGALGGLGHMRVQKVGSRLLSALADGVHERHDRGLDLVAKRVEALGGKATLVLVEPHVVWVALGIHELGLMLELADDLVHIGLKACPVIGGFSLVPHGIGLAGKPGPGFGFFGGNGACLALVAAEHANLVEQLRVVDLSAGDGLARERAHELNGLFAGQEFVMFAGKGAHSIGAGRGAVGGGNRRAIELGNLEQVLAGPQLALELAELLDAFARLGLLIEFLSHTYILDLADRAPRVGVRPVCTATCLVPSANKTERGDMLAECVIL